MMHPTEVSLFVGYYIIMRVGSVMSEEGVFADI